jgi:hypothetical protein
MLTNIALYFLIGVIYASVTAGNIGTLVLWPLEMIFDVINMIKKWFQK